MSCTITGDCYTYDPDTKNINGAKCGDNSINANCICNNGTCASMDCADDSYCVSTFGADSKCVSGSCTNKACSVSADCPPSMSCMNGICFSKQCSDSVPCPEGSSCIDGYCVTDTEGSGVSVAEIFFLLILIVLIVVFSIMAYVMYKRVHKK